MDKWIPLHKTRSLTSSCTRNWLEAEELYANGTHRGSLIHGYNINMYYTVGKNVKHKDNVFDYVYYVYGTWCGFYSLVLSWVDDVQQ